MKAKPLIAIILATIIWGTSFIAIKNVVNDITPGLLIFIRFLLGTIILFFLCVKRFKGLTKKYILYCIGTGIILAAAYIVQTIGMQYATSSTSSLLENTYIIVVPFLTWGLARQRPRLITFICIFATIVGILLISYSSLNEVGNTNSFGLIFCLLGGVFYGINIVVGGLYYRDKDPIVFTFIQFAVITVVSGIYYLIAERSVPTFNFESITGLIYLGILCGGVAWLLRNYAQNNLSPNRVCIILAFTSVVALIISIIIGETTPDIFMILGAVIIVSAVIIDSTARYKKNTKGETKDASQSIPGSITK